MKIMPDAIDQVVGVNYNNPVKAVSYNYDSVGNRTSVVDNGVTTNYSTNNLNQYTNIGGSPLSSDLNGNLIADQSNSLSRLYFYDAQNRLTRAIVSGNTTDFDYDSKNRVVKRTLNAVPTFLIYDGWNLIEERNSAGVPQNRYVHGTQVDEILTKTDSAGTIYYHHDGLGSVTQITNAVGNLIERYLYDIFGKVTMLALSGVVITTSSRGNRFFFTGREKIAEAGIYDYRNRVYSENLGRFLQTDPIRFNAGDVNLYRYCGNRVLTFVDPWGLDCSTWEFFIIFDFEFVPFYGFDFNFGFTYNPTTGWSVFFSQGPAYGFNFGANFGAGFNSQGVAGNSNNIDVGGGPIGVTFTGNNTGFTGGAITGGIGFGGSFSQTTTTTFR
jgi:RHS repeat-associated protein